MKKIIKKLESEILKHKKLYYSGHKEIEDEEYDKLENNLIKLDPENPVLRMIGSNFFSSEKIKHKKAMLSLSKTYKTDELLLWINNNEVIAMHKIDGSSCSLIYKNNKFELAKTRGDGVFGENISNKVNFISNVPKEIKSNGDVEVRGEIFCKEENFYLLSDEMIKRGLDKPKSMRNIVAGILSRKENFDLAQYLDFFAFDIIDDYIYTSEEDKFDKLKKENFNLPQHKIIKNEKDLLFFLKQTEDFMTSGNYLIDGVVLSINDISIQKKMGYTSHHPKYKKAFKFEGEVKETIIEDITWQISRFGVFTPVAELKPVQLTGASISRVTLHNLKTVKNFNLKKGDKIKIIRSGEVIPKFISVVSESKEECHIPSKCEFCNNKLIEEDVRLICNNENCAGRKSWYILNFIKKIGIDDLSEKRLDSMIKIGIVNNITDLFTLKKADLLQLPKTQDKLASKIIKNIEDSKSVEIVKFLSSLSFVGGSKKSTELLLENNYDSLEKLFLLKEDDLVKIKGFAKKKAKDYIESLNNNKELINDLIGLGFNISFPKLEINNILNNQTFCITGDLSIVKNRKELSDIIIQNGGKVSSGVSSKLNYLICNEVSSSSKYKKALSLDIPIISEKDFEEMFNLVLSK